MKLNWFGLLHVIPRKSHAFVCRVDGKDLLSLVYGHLIGCFACQLQSYKSPIAIWILMPEFSWTIGIQESSEDPRFRSAVIGVEAKKLEVFSTVFSGGCHLLKLLQHLHVYNRRISELLYWCLIEMVVKTNMSLHSCLWPAGTRFPKQGVHNNLKQWSMTQFWCQHWLTLPHINRL